MSRPDLPVIFRNEGTRAKPSIVAVFPTVPGTNAHDVTVYAHVGQHGSAVFPWYAKTHKATPEQYADLLRELQGIYSREDDPEVVNLAICQRWTRRHDDARKADFERYR